MPSTSTKRSGQTRGYTAPEVLERIEQLQTEGADVEEEDDSMCSEFVLTESNISPQHSDAFSDLDSVFRLGTEYDIRVGRSDAP